VLSKTASPIISLLSASTNALLWVLRIQRERGPAVTEEDVRAMVRHGAQIGTFLRTEQQLVERVLRLADRRITDFMTVRRDVAWIDAHEPYEEILNLVRSTPYARYPVCDGDLDHVLGIMAARDFILISAQDFPKSLRHALRKPLVVHETMSALTVLERFKQATMHFAIVVDEYGGVQGVVSDTDLLEAIAGEMPSEEPEEPEIVQRDADSWLVDGSLPIADLKESLGIEQLPSEEERTYTTVAGFVLDQLKRIPEVADKFVWQGLIFEVVDMDGHRVDKVLVSRKV
jgi:putative hemolysin